MSSPTFPTLNHLNIWIDEQQSPTEIKHSCECLCHSRKVSIIMLETLDKQNAVLKESIDKVNKTVEELKKAIQSISQHKMDL